MTVRAGFFRAGGVEDSNDLSLVVAGGRDDRFEILAQERLAARQIDLDHTDIFRFTQRAAPGLRVQLVAPPHRRIERLTQHGATGAQQQAERQTEKR